MNATEELRRLLDERGVEWTYGDGTVSYANGERWCHAWSYNDGSMCVSMGYFTPEQAIAATLGRGECEMEYSAGIPERYKDLLGTFFCSECGSPIYNDMEPSFCIYCGAKVVDA